MAELKFHQEHCWARVEQDTALVGISDYAQEKLGKIIYIGLPEEEDLLEAGEPFGEIESSKVVSDLIAPVSGEVVEVNRLLEEDPTVINESPYEDGWIARVRLADPAGLDELMEPEDYLHLVGED